VRTYLESLFGTTTTLGFVIIKTLYILTAQNQEKGRSARKLLPSRFVQLL